jgi:type IV secretion system protein VirD4
VSAPDCSRLYDIILMSVLSARAWGPSHQHRDPPRRTRWRWLIAAAALTLLLVELRLVLLLTAAYLLLRGTVRLVALVRQRPTPPVALAERLLDAARPAEAVRAHLASLGGGAFLGLSPGGRWVTAHREHAVLVLGPPRSGKTSAVVIPAMLCASGAAVSTSTKLDVMRATQRTRAELGQVWVFDPAGQHEQLPDGVRRLHWSPVAGARGWDDALLIARAMALAAAPGAGTTNESHWRERSAALLAPLLLAAQLCERPIGEVLSWVLRQDLDPAASILEDEGAGIACDVLRGIATTDGRERSSIFSATAGVLAAYNSDSARRGSARPNFDAARFVASSDTLYITAPAHMQALAAPLVVGLLEQIRHAAYARHSCGEADGAPPVLLCLDELANIAPIHDLPALVSEAGGQGLHILACLQDLSQARIRWGESAADGLLSLFQTKLILDGIADPRTLDAISLSLGEYDRRLVSHSVGRSQSEKLWRPGPGTRTESVTYSTARQRVLSPGEVARLPGGHGLLLRGTRWGLLRLAPWHRTEPWRTLANDSRARKHAGQALHAQELS